MAMSVNASSHRARRHRYQPLSEINVTPFVDVMLVLLVVFMVSAPLITVGVPLNLPKGTAQTLNEPEQPITLSIQADGSLFLNEARTSPETVLEEIQALSGGNLDAKIYLRGDRTLLREPCEIGRRPGARGSEGAGGGRGRGDAAAQGGRARGRGVRARGGRGGRDGGEREG